MKVSPAWPLTGSECSERTVNNCVRLGECPSAETTVGVLLYISQSVSPIEKEAIEVQIGKTVKL